MDTDQKGSPVEEVEKNYREAELRGDHGSSPPHENEKKSVITFLSSVKQDLEYKEDPEKRTWIDVNVKTEAEGSPPVTAEVTHTGYDHQYSSREPKTEREDQRSPSQPERRYIDSDESRSRLPDFQMSYGGRAGEDRTRRGESNILEKVMRVLEKDNNQNIRESGVRSTVHHYAEGVSSEHQYKLQENPAEHRNPVDFRRHEQHQRYQPIGMFQHNILLLF